MESRTFIKLAAKLRERITLAALVSAGQSDEQQRQSHNEIQKEVNQLFAGLHNPTLPSAGKLRDIASTHGYSIEPKIHHRLRDGEGMWN